MNYILITPIKNEASNLTKLKETVLNQTSKPVLWTIVDSGSSDRSFSIACELFINFNWIQIIRQKKFLDVGYSHKNFAQAINEGYEYSRQLCEQKGLQYSYIGKTDATPILRNDYFESLLEEMENNPNLVITCGEQIMKYGGKSIQLKSVMGIRFTDFNDIRLYRKDFFEAMGGYPLFNSPDSILLIKAVNRGKEISIVHKTNFIKPRLGGSKNGIWKGYILKGKGMYGLGYHPLLMLMNAVYFSFKLYPHYQGMAIFMGYLTDYVKMEEKTNELEIIEYFGIKRVKEIIIRIFQLTRMR